MAKAYALRDAREASRSQVVKEKYDLQWREACDDARTLDSKVCITIIVIIIHHILYIHTNDAYIHIHMHIGHDSVHEQGEIEAD
jgi:hypothetical protein